MSFGLRHTDAARRCHQLDQKCTSHQIELTPVSPLSANDTPKIDQENLKGEDDPKETGYRISWGPLVPNQAEADLHVLSQQVFYFDIANLYITLIPIRTRQLLLLQTCSMDLLNQIIMSDIRWQADCVLMKIYDAPLLFTEERVL